jgi:hypothetical protein
MGICRLLLLVLLAAAAASLALLSLLEFPGVDVVEALFASVAVVPPVMAMMIDDDASMRINQSINQSIESRAFLLCLFQPLFLLVKNCNAAGKKWQLDTIHDISYNEQRSSSFLVMT